MSKELTKLQGEVLDKIRLLLGTLERNGFLNDSRIVAVYDMLRSIGDNPTDNQEVAKENLSKVAQSLPTEKEV